MPNTIHQKPDVMLIIRANAGNPKVTQRLNSNIIRQNDHQ